MSRRGRSPRWKCRIFDVREQRVRCVTLFPRSDARSLNPETIDQDELRAAWLRVREGRLPTRAQASLRANELYTEWKEASGILDGPMTVAQLAELEKSSPGKSKVRTVKTMNAIISNLDDFVAFMTKRYPAHSQDIGLVSPAHVHDFLGHLRVQEKAEGTIRNALAYIRRMFEAAVERQFLPQNPCANVRMKAPSLKQQRIETQERALTKDQAVALLAACREPFKKGLGQKLCTPPRWLHPFVVTCLDACTRKGELLRTRVIDKKTGKAVLADGLCWSDINWDESWLRVTGKTGPEIKPMTRRLADELQSYRRDLLSMGCLEDHVFVKDRGGVLMDPKKSFDAAVARSSIRRHVKIHDLRHTGLTLYSLAGVPPAVIQRIAGHSTPTMTSKYVHIRTEEAVREVRRIEQAVGAFRGAKTSVSATSGDIETNGGSRA